MNEKQINNLGLFINQCESFIEHNLRIKNIEEDMTIKEFKQFLQNIKNNYIPFHKEVSKVYEKVINEEQNKKKKGILLNKSCKTCQFNFKGICADKYYGEKILDFNKQRSCWTLSVDYHEKLVEKLPIDIKNKYIHGYVSDDLIIDYFNKND